jgi:hypothetical protein
VLECFGFGACDAGSICNDPLIAITPCTCDPADDDAGDDGSEPVQAATDASGPGVSVLGATLDSVAFGIAIDENYVYWGQSAGDGQNVAIVKVPRAGGAPVTLASFAAPGTFGGNAPHSMAVDHTSVYWSWRSNPMLWSPGAIMKAPLGGGTAVTLASSTYPTALAVDSTSVYWIDQGTVWNGIGDGSVRKVPLSGGAVTILADTAQPTDLGIDSSNVYWTTSNPDGTFPAVMKVPVDGGSPVPLAAYAWASEASGVGALWGLGVSAEGLFYFLANAYAPQALPLGDLVRVPLAGGSPTIVLSSVPYAVWPTPDDTVTFLAVGEKDLFWASTQGLWSLPLSGGKPVSVTSDPSAQAVSSLAVDSRGIYWLNPVCTTATCAEQVFGIALP